MTHCRLNGNHQSDPKAPCRGRLQIGTASGIKLECLSGFASEYPSGFIGIRNLTAAGKIASDEVLSSRDEVIAEGLSILSPDELKVLGAIAERVLRNRLENLEHSYRICRLCCYEGCTNCPIDAELHERGVDRENSGEA